MVKTFVNLRANLNLTKVERKSTQGNQGLKQTLTESQVDPTFLYASTCEFIWPWRKAFYCSLNQ